MRIFHVLVSRIGFLRFPPGSIEPEGRCHAHKEHDTNNRQAGRIHWAG
ncbi:hypothetical protein M2305_002255 [Gluconobacter cerinus]|nr:hypothetical protein [Gluconobacter cerinus]MCW2266308.1 hypothetical protein [Gluconobacter cerinus]